MAINDVQSLVDVYWVNSKEVINDNFDFVVGEVEDLQDKLEGWDDLTEALTGKNLNTTAGKANYDFTNGWVRLEASGDIDTDADVVQANFQTRHRMDNSEPMRFHLHWYQHTSTTRTLTGKYRIIKNGEAPGSWVPWTATCSTAGDNIFPYTSGNLGQITDLFQVTATGFTLSTIIQVRFTRSDSNANGDVYALYLDAHYKSDQPAGSTEEYIK